MDPPRSFADPLNSATPSSRPFPLLPRFRRHPHGDEARNHPHRRLRRRRRRRRHRRQQHRRVPDALAPRRDSWPRVDPAGMEYFEELRRADWERESYPKYGDVAVLPFFVLFFLIARFFLDRFVFETVGRWMILGKGQQTRDVESDGRKRIRKFKESAWKFVYFLSSQLLGLYVTYDEPWFTNTRYFWVGPGDQVWPDQKIKLKLKAVYMYAAGFYTYSIFALVFWETRRSDFGVSMSHHVATVILIVLSYIFRFARVGSVVLALHDASDVFLEIGKMSKYIGAEMVASGAFILFVLSWVILRLIYYPFWIIWSTSYEVILTLDKDKHTVDGPIYYYVFNFLLICLLVLHVYWWVLIFRMLVKQIQARGQVTDDVRSDSEDEDGHEDFTKKKDGHED